MQTATSSGAAVLDNFSAQVGASDCAKVLLVALSVASVLVEHERISGLSLGLEDGVPELLGLDRLATFAFPLILLVQCLEFITVDISQGQGTR